MTIGTPPRARRRRKTKRLNRPSASGIFAKKIFIILIFLVAQLMFYSSDFFKLKEIRIFGNHKVTKQEILQAANIPLEHNIIRLPLIAFRQRLNSLYWIKDVKIKWALPGRIDVYVKERVPAALVRENGNVSDWFLADEDGMILCEEKKENCSKLSKIVVNEPLYTGRKIPASRIQSIIEAKKEIPEEINKTIGCYFVDNLGNVSMQSIRGGKQFKIKLGKPENIKHKMDVLAAILSLTDEKDMAVKYIDLRFKDPVIMPANAPATTPDLANKDG